MAIAEMEKISFIAMKSQKEKALKVFQSFQNIEIKEHKNFNEFSPLTDIAKKDINAWEDALRKITAAQTILADKKKQNKLKKLIDGRLEISLGELERLATNSNWQEIADSAISFDEQLKNVRKFRKENNDKIQYLRPWVALDVNPQQAIYLKSTILKIGTIESLHLNNFTEIIKNKTEAKCYYEVVFNNSKNAGLFIAYPNIISKQIEEVLHKYSFLALEYPYNNLPKDTIDELNLLDNKFVQQERQLLSQLEELAKQFEALEFAEEYFNNLIIRSQEYQKLILSKSAFYFEGWIKKENTAELALLLKTELKVPYYLNFEKILPSEYDEVPTALENKGIIKPFETLTEMYGMPKYNEIDPTPAMTPFYMIFFGMMIADIGYGLIMLAATLLAKVFLKPGRELKSSINFFYYLSFPTILWGLIYGSLFGMGLSFKLLSPTEDIITILILSIILGFIQLMTGLAINFYLNVKNNDVLSGISDGVCWMGILSGLVMIVLSQQIVKSDVLFYGGVSISVLCAVLVVLIPSLRSKNAKVKGLMKGAYALYGITGYVGDLVSYSRLMALGIAGGSISIAFNNIISALPFVARLSLGVVLAVVLHGLNMFLSLLGAYVHGIRLQYVEFFGKFYTGGGKKFKPFKTIEKHIYIKPNLNYRKELED